MLLVIIVLVEYKRNHKNQQIQMNLFQFFFLNAAVLGFKLPRQRLSVCFFGSELWNFRSLSCFDLFITMYVIYIVEDDGLAV